MEEQKIKSTDNARYFQCRILFQHTTAWYAIIHKYFHIKKPSRAEIFNVHLMKKMPFLKEKKQVFALCYDKRRQECFDESSCQLLKST